MSFKSAAQRKAVMAKYAYIRYNARGMFLKKECSHFRVGFPKTYSDYADLLAKLEGKRFKITRQYDNRYVLAYPKKMIKDNVVAIDVPKEYTMTEKERNEIYSSYGLSVHSYPYRIYKKTGINPTFRLRESSDGSVR